MSKKSQLRISHAVGNSFSFQQINERKCTFMLRVQHRCLCRAALRHFHQIGILCFSGANGNFLHILLSLFGWTHMFLMAQGIFLDKSVCCQNNISIRPEIFFHQQHFRTGMLLLEFQQSFRISGTESVDTLILVSHHKKIFGFRRQQRNDRMLDFRCILGLIHADIRVFLLKIRKQLRDFPKHIIGVNHLIIVIHQLLLPELSAVLFIDVRQMDLHFFLQLLNFLLVQHPVFYVGNQRPNIFQIPFCRIDPLRLLVNIRQHGRNPLFIREKLKCRPACLPAIVLNHPGADAVNGPKFQPLRHLLSEFRRKPVRHVLRRRHRIGDSQDVTRIYPFAVNHISQPRHQHRRLARARHCQKKHRPVHTLHGTFLLLI